MFLSNDALESLKRARQRIAQPERWCQHVSARDSMGGSPEPRSKTAVQWCILGAIEVETVFLFDDLVDELEEYLKALMLSGDISLPKECGISGFNDHHTHNEILDFLDGFLKKIQTFVVLQSIEHGYKFFSKFTPGEDPSKPTNRVLGWADSVESAQNFLKDK